MTGIAGRHDRAAWILLVAHGVATLFGTLALVTFLADSTPPAWLLTAQSQQIMRWSFRITGPAVVVLGFLAAALHAGGRVGWKAALAALGLGSIVALASELTGTSTGYPFGEYAYTPLLGYRILGLVPFPIPVSWTYMLYCSLAMVGRLLPARDSWRDRLAWALLAGLFLTAWDVSMDPAMVRTNHWVWRTIGPFYGMPFSNWAGWYLTGVIVSLIMLTFIRPSIIARRVSPGAFPLWLYAVNGILPIAVCLRYGMTGAAVLGTIAMAIPLVLATRAPSRAGETTPENSLTATQQSSRRGSLPARA